MSTPTDTYLNKIASSFSKASSRYETVASIQDQAAEFLVRQIEALHFQEESILEVGAGTGLLTRRLLALFPKATFLAVDLSPKMLHVLWHKLSLSDQRRLSFLTRDMDELHEQGHTLITSSFALQWSKRPLEFLTQSSAFLQPKGCIAHIFPLIGSLSSLVSEGFIRPNPQLSLSMNEVHAHLHDFDILYTTTFTREERFATPLHALLHIKSFGGAISSALPRSLFSLRHVHRPITCNWTIGCIIARRK